MISEKQTNGSISLSIQTPTVGSDAENAHKYRDRGARAAGGPTDGGAESLTPGRSPGASVTQPGENATDSTVAVGREPTRTVATPAMAHPAKRAPARRSRAPWTPRQRAAIEADARGEHVEGICAAVLALGQPLARSTLRRWRALPAWPAAVQSARAAIGAETDARLAAARLSAVVALQGIVDRPDGVDPSEVSQAARALLAATMPPGEAARQRARRDVLAALPAALRLEVERHLDGTGWVSALTDDELEAALAAPAEGNRR